MNKLIKKILRWFKYKDKQNKFFRFGAYGLNLPVKPKSSIYEINNFAFDLDKVIAISYTSDSVTFEPCVTIEGTFNPIYIYIPVPEDDKAKEIYGKLLKAWKEVR